MTSGGWVCALHVRTAGQGGAALGSDEAETVTLAYVVIDVVSNQVLGEREYAVRPTITPSEELQTGQPLDVVVQRFDEFVRSLQVDPHSPLFRLVADGQPPLRQCLHPEACSKELDLPSYYARFHDLRKEFVRAYRPTPPDHPKCLLDMLNYLGITPYAGEKIYAAEVKDMASIIQRIITDGFSLELPETIVLETENSSKDYEIDGNSVVRVHGTPCQSSDKDIANFFRGLNVAKGGVALCLFALFLYFFLSIHEGVPRREEVAPSAWNVTITPPAPSAWNVTTPPSQPSVWNVTKPPPAPNAWIVTTPPPAPSAWNVTTPPSQPSVWNVTKPPPAPNAWIVTTPPPAPSAWNVTTPPPTPSVWNATAPLAYLSRGAEVIVEMRGLPYNATSQQVMDFFSTGEDPVNVLDGAEGILFVTRADGRATGDAFVLFAKEKDSPKALSRHRKLLGDRYIELFRSTAAQVQNVLNRSLETHTSQSPVTLLPQHVIASGSAKDCVRLRGFPYEAQVWHILMFLDKFAQNIVTHGVHMVHYADGYPSGEAFIQMDSENSAFMCAQQKHRQCMSFGKKQRCIEVLQCSGDDMNLVLTGGVTSTTSPSTLPPP
ncbi:RNA-binding protein fusilli-like [Bicyclus anynana]|uniref:RNA-binding protein fusilli-like n=1 Tax=Bicyclus anynana TaxID=110368 RepID=A0A6J1NLM4_BICAN|nr:RNA-binding protein fusilli-like [Bicyclus anynana]